MSILEWCQTFNILYTNTALEYWFEYPKWNGKTEIYEHTLYNRHMTIKRKYIEKSTTAVIEMGMNPGLISHFAKAALLKIASETPGLGEEKDCSKIAEKLSLKVVQVSERDSQVSLYPRKKNTFYNTWSCIGFYEEATDPCQIGCGTHEIIRKDAILPTEVFPGLDQPHQIFLPVRAMDIMVNSYEPLAGDYTGYCIPHGEASSLTCYLSRDKYRPSVYYVYLPCSEAIESLNEIRANSYKIQENYLVYESGSLAGGYDAVGALLLFENDGKIKSYWSGTVVTNAMAKNISLEINATCLQVAGGILAAVDYCLSHPKEGVLFPESLDSGRVLEIASPVLGNIIMDWVDFDPKTVQFNELIRL